MFHGQNQARINIAKLVLQESGSYNTVYSRPYETYVDGNTMNGILNRIDEMKSHTVTGSALAGIASNIISPSATPGNEIAIPYGWNERRIRFVMEAHVTMSSGNIQIYYLQGYTSHRGVTPNGSVDPNMEFVVNSYIRVSRLQELTPYGYQTKDIITESAHVINGNIITSGQNPMYTMRPKDIYTGIQTANLESSMNGLIDTRNGGFSTVASNRNNNLASSYLAKVIDGYQHGSKMIDFGQGPSDILGQSSAVTLEASIPENIFFRTLANMKGLMTTTRFTFGDLQRLDSNVENVTGYTNLGATGLAKLHCTGQTAYWNSVDRETLVATILSNSVPALMMSLLLTNVAFRSTNHDIGGRVTTVFLKDPGSLTTADLSQNLQMFIKRFETEVMYDITHGNQELYQLEMFADLFGDTTITLMLGSNPAVTYTTPSFCDGLMTPVVTLNKQAFNNVVHDFETMFNQISNVTDSGPRINMNI